MYDSLILRAVSRIMLPLLIIMSLFMLLRGHDLPGGGFIGGLLGASAIILQIVAYNADYARRVIPVNYLTMAAVGVCFAAVWGLLAMFMGEPFLKGLWVQHEVPGVGMTALEVPGIGKLGTPLLFDIGVYLTVIGVTVHIALMLAEEPELYPMQAQMVLNDETQQDGAGQ